MLELVTAGLPQGEGLALRIEGVHLGTSHNLLGQTRVRHVRLERIGWHWHQDMSIWLTIAIGIVAALIGSLIASALGVGETRGIDWIKLIIQVALAAAGVALVAGRYASGTRRP